MIVKESSIRLFSSIGCAVSLLSMVLIGCDLNSSTSGGGDYSGMPEISTFVKDYYADNYVGYPTALTVDEEQVFMTGSIDEGGFGSGDRSKAWTALTDLSGTAQWQKLLTIAGATGLEADIPTAVELSASGELFMGVTATFFDQTFVLAKLDRQGNLLWDRLYAEFDEGVTFGLNHIQQMEELNNGDLLLLGDLSGNNSILALFDSTGSIKWSFVIGGVYFGLAPIEGGYVLTGMDKYEAPSIGNASLVTTISTDAEGKPDSLIKYSRWFNSKSTDTKEIHTLVDSTLAPDGSVYAVGQSLNSNTQDVGILVLKISSDGEVLWRKMYRSMQNGEVEKCMGNSIVVAEDGNIHISGRITVYNPDDMNDDWEDMIHLQLKPDGSVVNGRRFAEHFRSIELVSGTLGARLPSIEGNLELGWFIAGLHGEADGYDGNTRLWRIDRELYAAGTGTAVAASEVKVDDFTATMFDSAEALGNTTSFEEYTLSEVQPDNDVVLLSDAAFMSTRNVAP